MVGGVTVGAWCACFLREASLNQVILLEKRTLPSAAQIAKFLRPEPAVISIEEYQRLKDARGDSDAYELPPEIAAQVAEGRAHPERRVPYRRRAGPAQ